MLFPATSPCASVAAPPHVGEVGVRQAIRASATGALRPHTTTRAASRPATGTSPSSVRPSANPRSRDRSVRPSANPRSRGRSVRSRLAPKLPGLQRTLQLRQLRQVSLRGLQRSLQLPASPNQERQVHSCRKSIATRSQPSPPPAWATSPLSLATPRTRRSFAPHHRPTRASPSGPTSTALHALRCAPS